MLALTIGVIGGLVSSCSSGVDRTDPRAVAEKAAECYFNYDYAQLKTLVDPNDTFRLEQLDNLLEMAEKYKAENPDAKPKNKNLTFLKISDRLRGSDFTPETTAARVTFESEEGDNIQVFLTLVDGKWCYERIQ